MKPGSKVICIDDSINPNIDMEIFKREFPNWVKKGEHYTIREIDDNDGLVTSVTLEELRNPILFFTTINRAKEASFKIDRFRELLPDEVKENINELQLTN